MPATAEPAYTPPEWAERHWREFTHGVDAAATSLFPIAPLHAPPPRRGPPPLALLPVEPVRDDSAERAAKHIGRFALAVAAALFCWMAGGIAVAWFAGRLG